MTRAGDKLAAIVAVVVVVVVVGGGCYCRKIGLVGAGKERKKERSEEGRQARRETQIEEGGTAKDLSRRLFRCSRAGERRAFR